MTREWMRGLPGVNGWRKILPVRDGTSRDEKYEIVTHGGAHLLLRAADAALYRAKELGRSRIVSFGRLKTS